jgi:hypothetical protein
MWRLHGVSGLAGLRRAASWLGLLGIAAALAGCASSLASESYASSVVAWNYEPRPSLRGAITKVMSDAEADALIARAIVEHEIRRP